MKSLHARLLWSLPALLAAGPVAAHTGVGATHGFLAGLEHPIFGPDHLLAMVGVGLWAGLVGGRSLWAWPASFVLFMLVGGLLGLAGLELPAMELVIVGSVVALGLAVALDLKLHLAAGAAVVAAFALFHGNAHGLEAPADAGGFSYGLGFLVATAALHAAGLVFAVAARRLSVPMATRIAGALVALAGVALATG